MMAPSAATMLDLRTVFEPIMSLAVGVLVLILIVEAVVLAAEVIALLPARRAARKSEGETAPPAS